MKFISGSLASLAGCIFLVIGASTANAVVINTTTSSDLTVYDSNNDGVIDSAVSATDALIRVFGVGNFQRGVWEYDLSGVPTGATINSVSVLFEDRGTTVPGGMLLFGFAGDGTASAADGNLISAQIGSFNIVAGNLDYSVNLATSFFQNLVDASAAFVGIVMVSSNEGNVAGADFCSFDSNFSGCVNATGSTLKIDFAPPSSVPLPAALPLFASGLGVMGFIGWRRKKKMAKAAAA
jgi:hypothetical protein